MIAVPGVGRSGRRPDQEQIEELEEHRSRVALLEAELPLFRGLADRHLVVEPPAPRALGIAARGG